MFIGFILCLSRSSIVLDIFIAIAVIASISGICAIFLGYRMVFYLWKHYPDKAKEIAPFWTIGYKGAKLLDKECDIKEPEFYRLRANVKRAQMLCVSTVLLGVILMLLLVFVAFLFGR